MRWLDDITDWMDMNLSELQEIVEDMEAWHAAVCEVTKVEHDLATEQQQQHREENEQPREISLEGKDGA